MMNEEKLEHEIKEIILTLTYYLELGFKQLGSALDLLSFYIHRKEDDEPTFEFGQYSIIGFFLILLGAYIILISVTLFPPIKIAAIFASFLLLGVFLWIR